MQRRVGPLRPRLNKYRPVLCSDTPFAQSRNVSTQRRLDSVHIERRQIARLRLQEHGRQIIVRIDKGRLVQQRFSTFEQLRIRCLRIFVSAANTCKPRVGKNSWNCHQACLLDKATTRYQSVTPENALADELYYQADRSI